MVAVILQSGVVGLATAGCMSCITAPPSTLGVDAVAHPDCADEPLFYNVPVAAEALHVNRSTTLTVLHKVVAPLIHSRSTPLR
jgi:hypothetical protein